MSSSNPYYSSVPDNDSDFAQQASQHQRSLNPPAYHSQINRPDIDHQKPYFTQSDYRLSPIYVPPPAPPRPTQATNFFTSLIQKYKAKRRATDLTQTTYCPNCSQMSESFIVKKNSFIVWVICIILLVMTYVLFFLPFLFDALKNKHVVCKNCGKTKFIVRVW